MEVKFTRQSTKFKEQDDVFFTCARVQQAHCEKRRASLLFTSWFTSCRELGGVVAYLAFLAARNYPKETPGARPRVSPFSLKLDLYFNNLMLLSYLE